MIKRSIISLFISFVIIQLSFTQKNVQEDVYLHLNAHTLVSGETLLFSAYCKSKLTNLPSDLSKILYVELIGENETTVFQQKIKLQDGRGGGSFFISSLIPTGNYQLLAYTRWMKNFGSYLNTEVEIRNTKSF
ncbi:MAG: hypothetical protein HRT61_21735 [Ekhidna sp.]|nr:hypothetical protein [Ekhidna sp.]